MNLSISVNTDMLKREFIALLPKLDMLVSQRSLAVIREHVKSMNLSSIFLMGDINTPSKKRSYFELVEKEEAKKVKMEKSAFELYSADRFKELKNTGLKWIEKKAL